MSEGAVEVRVGAGGRDQSYAVRVGRGLRHVLGSEVAAVSSVRRWALIADDTVAGLHGNAAVAALEAGGLSVDLFTFPAGEPSKNRKQWSRLSDELLDSGYGRDCGVVGLGGGVTGDLAGFVAATFMRGVPVIQVPTTLLAMIDASVGGKTGVNTRAGKNLVGAFHPPKVVVVDPEFTDTLPRSIRAEGLAEALKHAMIRDAEYLADLEREAQALLGGDPDATARAVGRSIAIKADVVTADERESGMRKILNFGHTLGHGIEAASRYAVPHGHAVAIGMVAEAELGERLGVTDAGSAERIRVAVERFELPSAVPPGLDPAEVDAAIRMDKKGADRMPQWVPIAQIGQAGTRDGTLSLPLNRRDAHEAIFGGGGETPAP